MRLRLFQALPLPMLLNRLNYQHNGGGDTQRSMATREYFLEDYVHSDGIRKDSHGQPPSPLNAKYRLTKAINEMLGICKGLLADGQLPDIEISFLRDWLPANADIVKAFPGKQIYERVTRIYTDGIITDDEREDLKELLRRTAGLRQTIESPSEIKHAAVGNPATSLPFDEPEPPITFLGQAFSFTGKFVAGTRNWCVGQVVQRGATFHDKPTPLTNFLVIGALGSRDWAHTSFGRKIEAALKYKPPLKVVSESHWAHHLTAQPLTGHESI